MTRTHSHTSIINLQSTYNTPDVFMQKETGIIKISGRCMPANANDFFNPIFSWVNEYVQNPAQTTSVEFYFSFFDSTSSKYLMELLREIVQVIYTGKKLNVKWYYDKGDDDMLDVITMVSEELKVHFEIEEVGV